MSVTQILRLVMIVTLLVAAGCSQKKIAEAPATGPDYGRPLPPGDSALRLVTDPQRMPDLAMAYHNRDALLQDGFDQSLVWFAAPSSRQFYPFQAITHEQAKASLIAMADLLETMPDESSYRGEVQRLFDVYESVGYNNRGTVLFTGYYSPQFPASRRRTSRFTAPLYKRPADLVTDPVNGTPLGRQLPGGTIVPYATRRQIEKTNMFAGDELAWLEESLSAYIVQVNGSAQLRMTDGTIMYVGYAGKTDREYTGLGESALKAGLLTRDQLSLPAIKKLYRAQPEKIEDLINRNESYVFFTEYDGGDWPAGSLGVRVTPETTLATDKTVYPRGGLVLVDTRAVTFSRGTRPFLRFMLDQDTGGAIEAPGRADIYMGEGASAEILAGGQYAEGRLYYFFLKPEYVKQYLAGVPD